VCVCAGGGVGGGVVSSLFVCLCEDRKCVCACVSVCLCKHMCVRALVIACVRMRKTVLCIS
jgi:hypothetical protein